MERLRNTKARLISHKSILRNTTTLNTEMEASARDNPMKYIAVRDEVKQRGKSVAHQEPFEFHDDASRGSRRPRFGSAPNDGASDLDLSANDDDIVSETSSGSSSERTASVYNEKMVLAATAEIEETKARRARKKQADKEYRNR